MSSQICASASDNDNYYGLPIPGVSWSAWSYFLNLHWSDTQMNTPGWYDAAGALAAAEATAPGQWIGEDGFYNSGDFFSPAAQAPGPGDKDAQNYVSAAALYHAKNYAAAIPLFDQIIANPTSRFRAAAAYSAARSALDEGDYKGGFARMAKIFADPTMQDFYGATYDLTGTLAGQNDDAQLLAARLNEIEHFLTVPPQLACQSPVLSTLRAAAGSDLAQLLLISGRNVIDQNAQINPIVDLARIVIQRDSFTTSADWIANFSPTPRGQSLEDANPGYTQHARDEWNSSKDPLWAYALAIRTTDVRDIPSIQAARKSLIPALNLPDLANAASTLDALLFVQQVRIPLMAGQTDAALQIAEAGRIDGSSFNFFNTPGFSGDDGGVYGYVANGGVRYFIQTEDLDAARAWAAHIYAIQKTTDRFDLNNGTETVNSGLQRMLAQNWSEFLDADVANGDDDRWTIAPAVLNLLPANELIALSAHPGLPPAYRRALLSAGWIRLYMLGRWPQFVALFPEIREVFPELAPDIDNIDRAWLTRTKQRRAVEMLLRVPGLSPNVRWYFDRLPQGGDGRNQNIFAYDSHDPEDGNWWCGFNANQAIQDASEEFLAPLFGPGNGGFNPMSNINPNQDTFPDVTNIKIWHPLFKDVDFDELNQLAAVEDAPDLFNQRAVKWAKSSNWFTRLLGMDEQLPETLHLAVGSTRYACTGSDSGDAFAALYRLYPTSQWTKQTPYWFIGPQGYGPQ